MMRGITAFFAGSVLALALFGVAAAGPLEDGAAAYQSGDFTSAMNSWRPLADKGDALAQHNVGSLYYDGLGVPQNYELAIYWFLKAAEQGMPESKFNLGQLYFEGRGVLQNDETAAYWYSLAAEQGFAIAEINLAGMYLVGRGVPKDYKKAHMWFNLAASRASDPATREVAMKGRGDVEARMAPAQIAEAQRMAREWKPK